MYAHYYSPRSGHIIKKGLNRVSVARLSHHICMHLVKVDPVALLGYETAIIAFYILS